MVPVRCLREKHPTWTQYPRNFRKDLFRFRQVLQHIVGKYHVEAGVGIWQRFSERHLPLIEIRIVHDARIRIHSADVRRNPTKIHLRHNTGTGAEIQHLH